ncbi:MAG: protein kinase [Planctomycetota bacterium]
MSEAIRDEGDMALKALLSTGVDRPLDPALRERARRLAARHFGASGDPAHAGLLPEGAVIGTYRVERVLGMGGQAVVYLGRHVRLKSRLVAIKVPHGTETHRMLREADVMARLDHPGVVGIVDLDAEASPPYLTLEYCAGGSLADRIEAEGRLSEDEVLRITRRLCEALAFAHDREVIHRDLKPENVLFDSAGNPRIGDFGLGKVVAEQISLSLSQASRTGVAGTPLYMAPEQELPNAEVDARADLFALGKLIYHMLTGDSPRTLRPVEHVRQDLKHPWSDLVFKLTETFAGARHASARAVLAVLERWEPAEPQAPEAREAPGREEFPLRVSNDGLPARHDPWDEKLRGLFDRVFSDLSYAVAFLCVVGGVAAMIVGAEPGIVAVVLGAFVAMNARSEERKERERVQQLQAEQRDPRLTLRRRRSFGATVAGLASAFGFVVSFFTAMGGTIAFVLDHDRPASIAMIVAGFFLIGSMILLRVSRRLAAAQEVIPVPPPGSHWPGPPPHFAPPQQHLQAGPHHGPLVMPQQPLAPRPLPGDDPLPRA